MVAVRAKYSDAAITVPFGGTAVRIEPTSQVYVYEAGTGTLGANNGTPIAATMYAADTGGATLSNPFFTDAQGNFAFYLAVAQDAKVVVVGTSGGTLVDSEARVMPPASDILRGNTPTLTSPFIRDIPASQTEWNFGVWADSANAPGARRREIREGTLAAPVGDHNNTVDLVGSGASTDGVSFYGPRPTETVERADGPGTYANSCSAPVGHANGAGVFDYSYVTGYNNLVLGGIKGIAGVYGWVFRLRDLLPPANPAVLCKHGKTWGSPPVAHVQALTAIANSENTATSAIRAFYAETNLLQTAVPTTASAIEATIRHDTGHATDAPMPAGAGGIYGVVSELGRRGGATGRWGSAAFYLSTDGTANGAWRVGLAFGTNSLKDAGVDFLLMNGGTLPASGLIRLVYDGWITSVNTGGSTLNLMKLDSSDRLSLYNGTYLLSTVNLAASLGSSSLATASFSNTDAGASAHMRTLIANGGGASADAYLEWRKGASTQSFVMGIDGSDSNALVGSIGTAVGTSNFIRIATTGAVTFPAGTVTAGTKLHAGNQQVMGYTVPAAQQNVAKDADLPTLGALQGVVIVHNFSTGQFRMVASAGGGSVLDIGGTSGFGTIGTDPGTNAGTIAIIASGGNLVVRNRALATQSLGVQMLGV